MQFAKPEAVALFAKAGQRTDGDVVYLDPEFVLEQVAKVPREFDIQARNPANSVHIGGDHMVFGAVYGCRSSARATSGATPRLTTTTGCASSPRPSRSWTRQAA